MQFVAADNTLPQSIKLQYTFTLCNTRKVEEHHRFCFLSDFKPDHLLVSISSRPDKLTL